MAEVTGFTAERMLAMEDATIIDARLDGYDLVLITKDGTEINVGDVRGPIGPVGPAVAQLSDVGDVASDVPSDGDALVFDSGTGEWSPVKLHKGMPVMHSTVDYPSDSRLIATSDGTPHPDGPLNLTVTNTLPTTRTIRAELTGWARCVNGTHALYSKIAAVNTTGWTEIHTNSDRIQNDDYRQSSTWMRGYLAPGGSVTFQHNAWVANNSYTSGFRYTCDMVSTDETPFDFE